MKAEALVVAVEYQDVGADIKVAVPEMVIETDPSIFRQILHLLVGNAIRHGGKRVAIWAVEEGGSMRISVSDDGPGFPRAAGSGIRPHRRPRRGGGARCARSGFAVIRGSASTSALSCATREIPVGLTSR